MEIQQTVNSAKQATGRFFKRLFLGILILLLLAFALTYLSTQFAYSEGDRAGVVSKLSKKGYVIKTFEGELNVGAQGQVGNMVNNTWAFTVAENDENVAKLIEDAVTSGKRVKLHYEQRYLKFSWMGDTEYFVTKVEPAQ
jgi:hypothetical protein